MPAVGVEEDTSTIEDLDFEIPCESPSHNGGIDMAGEYLTIGHWWHEDTARWDYTYICPRCGASARLFVCEGKRLQFKEFAKLHLSTVDVDGCGQSSLARDWIVSFTPINGSAA